MNRFTVALKESPKEAAAHAAAIYIEQECDMSATARELGVTRQYMYVLMTKHKGLQRAIDAARRVYARQLLTG